VGPLRPLRGHLPLKVEDVDVLTVLPLQAEGAHGPAVVRLGASTACVLRRSGHLCGDYPLKGEDIVVLTVLPLQGEVPAEQAEGAHGPEVVRLGASTARVLGRSGHLCG